MAGGYDQERRKEKEEARYLLGMEGKRKDGMDKGGGVI
jgi:hypothetical protein